MFIVIMILQEELSACWSTRWENSDKQEKTRILRQKIISFISFFDLFVLLLLKNICSRYNDDEKCLEERFQK